MTNDEREKLTPFEAMIGECARELLNEEVDAALRDADLRAIEGVDLDAWFERAMVGGARRRANRKKRPRARIYAASIAAALVAAALAFAMAEPARAAIIRFFVERFAQYSEYSVAPSEDMGDVRRAFVKPEYIPDGFVMKTTEAEDSPDTRDLYWINGDNTNFIGYFESSNDSSIMIDTENADIRHITLHGVRAEVIRHQNGRNITIQFFHDNACYAVFSDLSYEETLRIAQSIPLKPE
jgi:hypothetical protein